MSKKKDEKAKPNVESDIKIKETDEQKEEKPEAQKSNFKIFLERYSLFIKKLLVVFVVLILILIVGFYFFNNNNNNQKFNKIPTCGDNSFYETCSFIKPYYCENGTLIEKASVCGCPENLTKNGDSCISKYQTEPKNISLKYVLRGEQGSINFTVYKGVMDYLNSISKSIRYNEQQKSFRPDFELKRINQKEQRKFLLPLVVKIENLASSKEDQARIAISVVQNIEYNKSVFFNNETNKTEYFSKYPYEYIYKMKSVCEGKSELLAFLLKEIGYGSVLFYYPEENHKAVGIKCPLEYSSYGSGYCFVETTGPSIITDNKEYYFNWGELSDSPEISLISNGISFPENAYEYKDAKKLIQINNILKKRNFLGRIYQIRLKNLIQKYGLNNYQL